MKKGTLLPPALAKEVIFSVVSVCVCVTVCVGLHSAGCTIGPTDLNFCTHTKGHYISDKYEGQDYKTNVKVIKVKNVKIPIFSLVSETVVRRSQSQGQWYRPK